MITLKVKGEKELINLIKQVGKVSARSITHATKAGSRIALRYAKDNVYRGWNFEGNPSTGSARNLLQMFPQRKKTVNKRVYWVGYSAFDPRPFYTRFLDYGFTHTTHVGKRPNLKPKYGQYLPGNKFLRDSIEVNREKIRIIQLETLYNRIKGLK